MEDDDIETSSSGSLVPLALAILAIVLGAAGLYFGLTANQRLNPLSDSMAAGSSSSARLEKEIAGLETKFAELSARNAELEKALSRVRLYSNQSETAVKQLASNVRDNRSGIVELTERLNEVITRGARPAPAAASSSAPEQPATETATAPASASGASAEGTYTIASGDTFAKVAGKLGVSLQALLDANPDADPRRLGIGQVINIPANR